MKQAFSPTGSCTIKKANLNVCSPNHNWISVRRKNINTSRAGNIDSSDEFIPVTPLAKQETDERKANNELTIQEVESSLHMSDCLNDESLDCQKTMTGP